MYWYLAWFGFGILRYLRVSAFIGYQVRKIKELVKIVSAKEGFYKYEV